MAPVVQLQRAAKSERKPRFSCALYTGGPTKYITAVQNGTQKHAKQRNDTKHRKVTKQSTGEERNTKELKS